MLRIEETFCTAMVEVDTLPSRTEREAEIVAAIGSLRAKMREGTFTPFDPVPFSPGSAEKIATLALRYESGIELWNPMDSREFKARDAERADNFVEEPGDDDLDD